MVDRMKRLLHPPVVAFAALLHVSCVAQQDAGGPTAPGARPAGRVTLEAADRDRIGRRIWQNEAAGTVSGLTSWNRGERFASLGIGHFIWYPAGVPKTYEESFPGLVVHLRRSGVAVPGWLASARYCPWPDRSAFLADRDGARLRELRQLLAATVTQQTDYIILRMEGALPKMLQAVPAGERQRVQARFHAMTRTPGGMYALIDYVNFKGEGTNPKERYQGQGWGLLQVLQEMTTASPSAAPADFSRAAKKVLDRRIRLAPKPESQWRAGWFNRCDTYARPF